MLALMILFDPKYLNEIVSSFFWHAITDICVFWPQRMSQVDHHGMHVFSLYHYVCYPKLIKKKL